MQGGMTCCSVEGVSQNVLNQSFKYDDTLTWPTYLSEHLPWNGEAKLNRCDP